MHSDSKEKAAKPLWRRILRIILIILLICVIIFAALLIWLTVTEYKPADSEEISVQTADGAAPEDVREGSSLTYMTWNVGYGALGDNADFFMDGGHSVKTADKARVQSNLDGIQSEIEAMDPDYLFMQEVDTDASRSSHIDESQILSEGAANWDFAYNYKVKFIPYPIPPIGEVNAGIMTASSRTLEDASRIQLPCPFKWPVRLGNLKRCLLVNRTPVLDENGQDTGKELVSVNLHLEAYDSGEGKAAQTEMLRQVLQEEADKGNYVIAGGDFNQTFSGTDDSMYPEYEGRWHCGELDESAFSDEWQFVMDNTHPTCRSLDQAYAGADHDNFQYYMIDGFIVSSNVQVDSVSTQDLEFVCSDHAPVVMQVTLK